MDYSQRVLIVEDQREVSRLFHSALISMERNLELISVLSGEEAILETRHKGVDLFVVDYRLPGINGLELFHKMKKLLPSAKMIMITGVSDPFIRDEIAGVKPFAFFIKPVPMPEFLASVTRALDDGKDLVQLPEVARKQAEKKDLAKLINELKKEINARAILLLDNQGRILVRSGDLQNIKEGSPLINALVAILASANKVDQVEGHQGYPTYHIFRGEEVDMFFTPLNNTRGILVTGEKLVSDKVIVENIRHILKSRQLIEDHILRSEESVITSVAPPPTRQVPMEDTAHDLEMDPIMDKLKKKASTDELDAFWNEAVEENTLQPLHADDLSYDQARKLGLTPGDE